jgi:hypothetical protein
MGAKSKNFSADILSTENLALHRSGGLYTPGSGFLSSLRAGYRF